MFLSEILSSALALRPSAQCPEPMRSVTDSGAAAIDESSILGRAADGLLFRENPGDNDEPLSGNARDGGEHMRGEDKVYGAELSRGPSSCHAALRVQSACFLHCNDPMLSGIR